MKKIISLILISFLLSGCSFLRPHKMDVEQGNIITPDKVSQLRIGMTEFQVLEVMGNPVFVNILSANRLDYVYTFQPGYGTRIEKRVSCLFQQGRLKEIIKT
jgi:outer membrane protein assembly factor BamE